jgi:hypothetical protein
VEQGPRSHYSSGYSNFIAARQLGSARTTRMEDRIGDGVGDIVVAARMCQSGSTQKPSFARVTIR